MSLGTALRLAVSGIFLALGFRFVLHTQMEPSRAALLVTAVICAVTALYAVITYEILLQNQAMARAATESTRVMERSLRFSFAPNLLFRTLNTKDPKLQDKEGFRSLNNDDYRRAMREYADGQQQSEFVFAVVQNVGRGSATNLRVEAQYRIQDNGSSNPSYSVTKQASVQILPSGQAIGLFIFVSKVPTGDDGVELISASVTASDYYRDALHEPLQTMLIDPDTHRTESDPTCVIKIA